MQSRSKLGVCSWSLQASSPADLCGKIAQTGLSACQLALDPLLEGQWGEIETINTLHAAGVEILSGMIGFKGEDYSTLETIKHTGGVRLDAHWEYNRNHAKHASAMAQRLGLKLVTFHAGFIPHEAGRERTLMIERLREVCDRFDDRGVRVGFETGQESAHTLLDALNELKRPQVGVNFDPANMILYAMGDPIAALRELSPRVVQVHIKDAVKTPTPGQWGSEVPAGTGQVDWKAFFGALNERGLSVNRLIEREAGENRVADIKRAKDLVMSTGI